MNHAVRSLAGALAVAALGFAPASFAGHGHDGRGGYHHGGQYAAHGHHGGWNRGHVRRYRGHGRYRRGHNDAARWIGGAIVVGAIASLVADVTASAPSRYEQPMVTYRRADSVYGAPVDGRVYSLGTVYTAPGNYGTRYLRSEAYDDAYDDYRSN